MHVIPTCDAVSPFSSTSTLMNVTPGVYPANSTNFGPINWHGGHHEAVKSTTTILFAEIVCLNSSSVATMLTICKKSLLTLK